MIEYWLKELEEKNKIDILFASETGSRVWGGATSQSDHDIRFIFKHQDVKTYLSLGKAMETITDAAPYDAQGWDLFKAFTLLQKSNPGLMEWAFSPLVYRDKNQFSGKLRNKVEESYSPFSLYQHYIHLMERNIREISDQDFTERSQKKLIQAIRAYLLSKSIILTQKVPVNALYSSFSTIVPDHGGLVSFYNTLLEEKQSEKIVSSQSVKEMIIILKNERSTLDKQSSNLPKGEKIKAELDQWIWKLLSV